METTETSNTIGLTEESLTESPVVLENEESFTEKSSEFITLKRKILKSTDIKYFLYTRNNPNNENILLLNDASSIQNSHYNQLKPLRIIIHGFNNNYLSDINVNIKDAYLDVEDVNVIVLDWSSAAGSTVVEYFEVIKDVPDVGKYFAQFIRFLIDFEGTSNLLDRTIVIGFSLGAHIAGMAGKKLRKAENKSFQIIVALDPAAPGFSLDNPSGRLNRSDAEYLIVIHTASIGLGFKEPIGHVDYYPNFADFQPGCFALDLACHHVRAWEVSVMIVYENCPYHIFL